MEYRVYDTKQKKWIWNKVYLTPDGELYIINQSVFGWTKLPLVLSQDRYVYHRSIDLTDKDGKLVYVGDWLRAKVSEDRVVVGIVIYAHELSSYVILCDNSSEYFTLGSQVCEYIQVIGNVFDGITEDKLEVW